MWLEFMIIALLCSRRHAHKNHLHKQECPQYHSAYVVSTLCKVDDVPVTNCMKFSVDRNVLS